MEDVGNLGAFCSAFSLVTLCSGGNNMQETRVKPVVYYSDSTYSVYNKPLGERGWINCNVLTRCQMPCSFRCLFRVNFKDKTNAKGYSR